MTFDDMLAQILDLLKRQGRISYGALKRRYDLDDAYLEDLKDEIIHAQRLAVDEDNRVLVWVGAQASASAQPPVSGTPALTSAPAADQAREPLSYTPKHLAEKILTSRSALEGERKQVTVLFCDLANSTPIAERIGPEAMHMLLNRFFELALNEVHRYEGTINQFLGDGSTEECHKSITQELIDGSLVAMHFVEGYLKKAIEECVHCFRSDALSNQGRVCQITK